MRRLIGVGNVIVDLVASVPSLPERGGDVIASRSAMSAGGTFNVLAAAARQGLPAVYAGAHGTGPFGDLARAALHAEGVGILLEPTAEEDTGYDVVLVDGAGERTFVTVVGAEATLTPERLERVLAEPDDVIFLSGYALLRDPNRSAITGWLGGIPESALVLVDPGPLVADIDPDTLRAVLERADWLSCNEREAAQLLGDADGPDAALRLADAFPGTGIVVRRGAEGCIVVTVEGQRCPVPGFAVRAIDTNGAGDAHTGAFLAALASGAAPADAAYRANAAAALAVTSHGPATAPDAAATDGLLAGFTPPGGPRRPA